MSFPYLINDVVLARVPNGKIYYTKIRSISLARKECVAEFDDGSVATVEWTNIFDVAAETDVIVCVVCKQGDSELLNEIILCDTCNVGYHQECHPTKITAQHIAQEKWYCHYCVNKGKNPYVTNPFENSRSRSPSKRKRKLIKAPPKPKTNPKKRRKLERPPPKPSKTSKSYVAKKCTVSIIKQSIQELESVVSVSVQYSDASNCSLEGAAPVTPPQEETQTVPTPPVSLPLPHRPVNAVQPLNHSMVYPVCSPPPLQMSPLVKKPPRIPSCSPPPLVTPRDVTVNHDVIMSSLPPLQKARDVDCDPLRNIPNCPSSSWTCTSLPSSKLKKSPVCETHPVQPTASTQEPSKTVEDTDITHPNPAPSLPQPPQVPPVDSVSNISSEQIRGLYMRLYDFLQQTRAQGNPVIDREVVQHLISYGNDQIQRLSTASTISNSEQIDERSTTSQVTSLNNADNVEESNSRGTSSSSKKSVETSAKSDTKEVEAQHSIESQKHDSELDRVTAHIAVTPIAGKEAEPPPPCLNSRQPSDTDKEVESREMLVDQTIRDMSNSSGKETVTSDNMSPLLDPLPSPFEDSSPVSPPMLQKSSQAQDSTVEKLKEPLADSNDVPHSLETVLTKSALSARPVKLVTTTKTSKADTESKTTKKMICQPLAPINTQDMMGPFIQTVKKKTIKKSSASSDKNSISTTKADLVKSQGKKKKQAKRSTKSVPSRKRSKPDPPMISVYTAVQAGNSVIITPNSASDLSTKNAVPVQFITEAGAPLHTNTSDELSKIFAEYSANEGQCVSTTKQKSAESKPLSFHPSPAQCIQSDLPVNIPTSSIPTPGNNRSIDQPTIDGPLTPSTCLDPVPFTPPAAAIPTSNHTTFPKTSAVPSSTYSTSCQPEVICQKNETSIRTFEPVETSNTAPKSDETLKTNSQISSQFSTISTQHPCEQSASPPSTTSNLPLNNVLTNDKTTSKPRLRNDSISTSDTKRTSTSDRSSLTRESKNQAKDNIKSFTIFDSYSSLFDSDDDDDDVFVTQKPSSQASSEPRKVDGYNHMTAPSISQRRENFGPDSEKPNIPDDVVKNASSSQISLGETSMVTTTNTPPELTLELSQPAPISSTLSLDELGDAPNLQVPVSSTELTAVSVSSTPEAIISSITSSSCAMISSGVFSTTTASSSGLLSASFDLETSRHPTMNRSLMEPSASPPSDQIISTTDPKKPVILMARHISQIVYNQMLLVASVKRTSELAVRAAVIRLEEGWTTVNLLSATLLHGFITAAIKNNKIRNPVPVTSSQNLCSVPVTSSLNLCSVPVTSSQNLCSVPVTSSLNLCSVPVSNTSTQVRAEKLARTNTSDENSEPNKNNISGQCYNCYSPAQIACRRCANALYCSLRCELEHLAIHRRECCKRQS